MQGLLHNDSDQWFTMLDVADPAENDLELFLDFMDKIEELVREM